MVFYNEYFDFGPKCLFGVRFNSNETGRSVSPFGGHVNRYIQWNLKAKAVEENSGFYCFVFHEKNSAEFPLTDGKNPYENIVFFLLEKPKLCSYSYLLEVSHDYRCKNHHEIDAFKEYTKSTCNEAVYKRANIIAVEDDIYTLPIFGYRRCQEKQQIYLGNKYEFGIQKDKTFNPCIGQILKLLSRTRCAKSKVHGMDHFRRVEAYGMTLLDDSVDADVVRAFAYLHDCCRENDGTDPNHGPRAADFIENWRYTLLSYLDDTQFGKLQDAIRWHTGLKYTHDPTINACFDADRLDLDRVGITPDPEKMASERGWFHAKFGFTGEEIRRLAEHRTFYNEILCLKEIQDWHNSIIDQHFGTKGNGGVEQTL